MPKPAAPAHVDMPGRRNLARERAAHQLSSPAQQAALYSMLHTQLPHAEVVLIGQQPILHYLGHLGVRRLNKGPLTWRIVNRWRTHHGCPILRGNTDRRYAGSPLSTNYALTAWLLSRFTSCDLFNHVASARHTGLEEASTHAASRRAA